MTEAEPFKKNEISLPKFWDLLNALDWTYEYSDDHRVWKAGGAAMADAQAKASQSEDHRKMFDAFKSHIFSGEPWKTVQTPKPERPVEEPAP